MGKRGSRSSRGAEDRCRHPETADEVLTADEAAAFLKITRKRLYQLPIPCVRLSVRTRRYLRADLTDFLKRRRTEAC